MARQRALFEPEIFRPVVCGVAVKDASRRPQEALGGSRRPRGGIHLAQLDLSGTADLTSYAGCGTFRP